jgi:hypothetical protein
MRLVFSSPGVLFGGQQANYSLFLSLYLWWLSAAVSVRCPYAFVFPFLCALTLQVLPDSGASEMTFVFAAPRSATPQAVSEVQYNGIVGEIEKGHLKKQQYKANEANCVVRCSVSSLGRSEHAGVPWSTPTVVVVHKSAATFGRQ